jgi:hypothetical protein
MTPRSPGLRALAVCLGLLLVTEAGLRVTGRGPWRPFETFANAPRISDPDAERGWVNRPGRYAFPVGDARVTVTIDGQRRRSGGPAPPTSPAIGLFGGSYVFGFGVDDADVVSAHLGAENHAVPGYGTLQSVLAYEALPSPPPVVVYGLVGLHDGRNAGLWSWARAIERSSNTDADWGAIPTAWWDGEALRYGESTRYTHWPASEHVALIDLVERARNAIRDRFWRTKSETTVRLIERFDRSVRANGGRFLVALLDAPGRDAFYLRRLEALGIAVLDLRHPQRHEWIVPGDGHPDARMHAYWASRLRTAEQTL